MAFFEGINIAPKNANEAKKLIGKYVSYLRTSDIDKSGRGYFFPKYGLITGVHGRNIFMDDGRDIQLKDLVEMIEIQIENSQ